MAAANLPDYLTDPNAVLKDTAKWRHGRAPDYTNTRSVYEKTKSVKHEAGSLPELVQNLVKNWEIEASFKMDKKDWRTIDQTNHSFAVNGLPPVTAERFLELGTYNAVISANPYYSPEHSTFESSHKTFKRMMPTFVWEVLEVYSGPPRVAFKWRHWGVMKNDYVGFNDKGEKVTAKAHGGPIEIYGLTIATVDAQTRMQNVETWFDPMDMFRQIAPEGIITKAPRNPTDTRELVAQLDEDAPSTHIESTSHHDSTGSEKSEKSEDITVDGLKKMLNDFTAAFAQFTTSQNAPQLSSTMRSTANSSWVRLNSTSGGSDGEESSGSKREEKGAAVPPEITEETSAVHAELSQITPTECPFLSRSN